MAPGEAADAAGLERAADRLHDEFDDRVGPEVVDRHIADVAARFDSAPVRTFVPLLVRRYAGEALRGVTGGPGPSSGVRT